MTALMGDVGASVSVGQLMGGAGVPADPNAPGPDLSSAPSVEGDLTGMDGGDPESRGEDIQEPGEEPQINSEGYEDAGQVVEAIFLVSR